MLSPIKTMFLHFPVRAYTTVLVLALISWYAFRKIREQYRAGRLDGLRGGSGWLLVNYLLLLLFMTVLGRRSLDYDRLNFDVLYSYRLALAGGDRDMAVQIAANITVFVPVGMLGSMMAKRWGFLKGLLLGIGMSAAIELLQFALRCGTVEIDDLISNALGTLAGCVIAWIFEMMIRWKRKI